MKNISIIKSDVSDLTEIVKTNHSIFKKIYAWEPYSIIEYRDKLENKSPFIFVAKANGKIIGDSISFVRDKSLYIWIMGVSKKYRKQGIASKFFELNESIANKEGLESVSIKTYDVSNELLSLAKKRGYESDKEKNIIYLTLKLR